MLNFRIKGVFNVIADQMSLYYSNLEKSTQSLNTPLSSKSFQKTG